MGKQGGVEKERGSSKGKGLSNPASVSAYLLIGAASEGLAVFPVAFGKSVAM